MNGDNPRPEYLDGDDGYSLLYPIRWVNDEGGDVVKRLQLRRLTAKERLLADEPASYTERLLRIVESITGHPRAFTLRLDAADLDRLDHIFGYFTKPGPATGAN